MTKEKIIEILSGAKDWNGDVPFEVAVKAISKMEENIPQWIPFKSRQMTEEEKECHPDWDFILEGKVPDDRQRILVNIQYKGHEEVQLAEYRRKWTR